MKNGGYTSPRYITLPPTQPWFAYVHPCRLLFTPASFCSPLPALVHPLWLLFNLYWLLFTLSGSGSGSTSTALVQPPPAKLVHPASPRSPTHSCSCLITPIQVCSHHPWACLGLFRVHTWSFVVRSHSLALKPSAYLHIMISIDMYAITYLLLWVNLYYYLKQAKN
jgi:hypothetical protein